MKKFFLTLAIVFTSLCMMANTTSTVISNDYNSTTKVEQLNDSTIFYTNVERIEIAQNADTNLILIYDQREALVWAQTGSFVIELPSGDYKVVSKKPFARAVSKTEVMYSY